MPTPKSNNVTTPKNWVIELTNPLTAYYEKKGLLKTETVSESINRMAKDVAGDLINEIKNK